MQIYTYVHEQKKGLKVYISLITVIILEKGRTEGKVYQG